MKQKDVAVETGSLLSNILERREPGAFNLLRQEEAGLGSSALADDREEARTLRATIERLEK